MSSSIRNSQARAVLRDITHALYSRGVDPTLADVLSRLNRYFGQHPAGKPLPMNMDSVNRDYPSSHEDYNRLMRNLAMNLDILYETCLNQVDDVMLLNDAIHSRVQSLKHRQKRLEGRINDHLLVHQNAEGYFYTISDNFADLMLVDTTLTSARVDTESGSVTIPSLSDHSYKLEPQWIRNPNVRVEVDGKDHSYRTLSSFRGAVEDGMDNLMWAIEVELDELKEVIVTVDIPISARGEPAELTRVDIKPYGMSEVQCWLETYDAAAGRYTNFGSRVKTDSLKMTFVDNPPPTGTLRMYLRKTKHDYIQRRADGIKYRYVFGAKSITMLHNVYERFARLVTHPLSIPEEAMGSLVIDAVSLDANVDVPNGGEVRFYVAADSPFDYSDIDYAGPRAVGELTWHEIAPMKANTHLDKLARFDGAATYTKLITDNPTNDQLQLIPLAPIGPEQDRNPSQTIIEATDVYKIAELDTEPLVNSLFLLEGLNTTRIYSKSIDPGMSFKDLDITYWADVLRNRQDELTLDYGRIDQGNGFFYGGDVGAPGRDVYIETYLDAGRAYDTFMAELQKLDERSRTWEIKVFLNGRPLGTLGNQIHSMRLPWAFKEGLNHIVLIIRIPLEASVSMPFVGAISLMGDAPKLWDYGLVRLDKWSYVDEFTMRYNEYGQPKTFTIKDRMIISRRKPTTNFLLQYSINTGYGPEAIRLMAELSRAGNNPNITPSLNSYQLRFSYSGEYS